MTHSGTSLLHKVTKLQEVAGIPTCSARLGKTETSQDAELLAAQDVTNYLQNEPPCVRGNSVLKIA